MDMTTSSGTLNRTASRVYAPNSFLANGEWYKFGVTQDGVCKIDYTFLKNMGIDVDSIDPRQIQIYGNGGGMLAFLNSTPRIDDLRENAILYKAKVIQNLTVLTTYYFMAQAKQNGLTTIV
ncbi:MAG: hypothetical protein IPH33_12655 [Bacteroidetes bacterium]|nr:hypothetical protein [Bacteroidota bacterium]